jgi:hypothetical protein
MRIPVGHGDELGGTTRDTDTDGVPVLAKVAMTRATGPAVTAIE